MSKESGEPESARLRASSVPPRARTLPSTPPSTDDIDTDWGVDAESVSTVSTVSTVSATPSPVTARPARVPAGPLSQTLLGLSPPPPMSAAPAPARPLEARHNPLRSQTLIGMAAPPTPAQGFTPVSAEAASASAPAPRLTRPPFANAPPPAAAPTPAVTPPPSAAVSAAPEAGGPLLASSTPKFSAASALREQVGLSPARRESQRARRALAWFAAAAVAAAALGYITWHRPKNAPARREASPARPVPAAAATAAAATAAATTEPTAALAPPREAEGPASAEASVERPPLGTVTVTVNTVPPKGKFFHFGKQVGTAPFVVELKPGEQHAYEVFLPGHVTRKVVVDGSKPTITIGLRDEAAR